MTIPTYRVKDFDAQYTKSDAVKSKKIHWISLPVSFDDLATRRIFARDDGAAIYGAQVAIAAIAARMPERGLLHDLGSPLTAADLSIMTGIAQEVFETALQVLSDPKFGWLEVVDDDPSRQHPDDIPTASKNHPDYVQDVQDNTGQDKHISSSDDDAPSKNAYSDDFEDWWQLYPRKVGKRDAFKAWKRVLPEVTRDKQTRAAAIAFLKGRVQLFAQSKKAKGKFCPHGSTWLNDGRYDDDESEWQRDGGDNGKASHSVGRRTAGEAPF